MVDKAESTPPSFHIGAVARMTGLSPDTIRAWERRYRVIMPRRTVTHQRLYSRDDIERLALIKSLVDLGDRIGAIATLPLSELHKRLEMHEAQRSTSVPSMSHQGCRVAVLGDALPARLARYRDTLQGLDIVAAQRDPGAFEAQIAVLHPDILIVEYLTVHEETAADARLLLNKSGANHLFVIYGFGSKQAVSSLDTEKITPLRAPVDVPELKHVLLAVHSGSATRTLRPKQLWDGTSSLNPDYIPARRYSEQALAQVVSLASPIQCECPQHLVDLIRALAAFEAYSLECKHRSPADASLHSLLHATSAQARALLETALARVVAAEDLIAD